jgi:hypothetical protein
MPRIDWSDPRHHIGGEPQGLISHVKRFRRSPHTRDLCVIAICALIVAVFFMVSVVALVVDHFTHSKVLDFLNDGIAAELRVAFLGAAVGVVGWAYQAGNTRFGVADLFAAEIVTICRVCAVADFMPRYVRLFDGHAKFPPYKSVKDYTIAFDQNAKDLEVLDGDVVRFVTQFYIYLKALQDTLERGADPESAAWRESALTVIYNAFLAFESARQAITVLLDSPKERKQYVLTTLLSELPAYLLLLKELHETDGIRKHRIESRRETYDRLIDEIRADFANIERPDPTIDKADQDFARIVVRLWDASGAKDGTVSLPPRLRAHAEAAD